ncbi:glutamate--tRNA ligase, partial [Pseudanabaenaceae cyanobacterium LEGE 13415]|nr:glutamate--tRNA ligase [Pseudanabaenaceae cyanobacterium LEGE 13415]
PWLEQVSTLVAPSLSRLNEAIEMTRYLFQPVEFSEDAKAQMQQDGATTAIKAILEAMPSPLTDAAIQDVIKQVVKEQNLKKGVVMKSLRAALTGALQGPDLVQSWLLLNQKGLDRERFEQALSIEA